MPRIVRGGLIQATNVLGPEHGLPAIKKAMIDKHVKLIAQAAKKKVQVLCLQELFYGPYFCAEQETRWYDLTERVPDGPTIKLMQQAGEEAPHGDRRPDLRGGAAGVYYNTAAVIDADGTYLGKYRKTHIPHCKPGFWEKFYFRPGNLGYPVFETAYAKVGVYICYDRHFPEGARALGLNGAEIVFNPSATVAGLSRVPVEARAAGARRRQRLLRRRHQPRRHRGAVEHRRVLRPELLLRSARARSSPQAPRDKDEVVVADLDLDMIEEVRNVWQFYRDRRPDAYGPLVAP